MQSEGVNADGGRPQRHVRPPAYLEDYDRTAARRRQVSQPMIPHATEEPHRHHLSEAARLSPSPSDRASSPVSQYSWNVVDEWSPAAFDREHYYDRRQVGSMQSRTPVPLTILLCLHHITGLGKRMRFSRLHQPSVTHHTSLISLY